ncbi:lysis protein [Pseudomonas capsici]|uniref:lysis protein n=1 Tax=Pseudomonas capsici TaxID=2810614 RepID=UPI0021F1681A|nr:lysis protein [Pseudomonas capsici]MCV4272310.1 lysis protein [Pseudomonas capsici]
MGVAEILKWLLERWQILLIVAVLATGYSYGQRQWSSGYEQAQAEGASELAQLKQDYAEQALAVAKKSNSDLQLQVNRAQAAEETLFSQYTVHADEVQQLKERIAHVTKQYKPEPSTTARPIPHCVFTAGWLRDYNTALGVSAPRTATTLTAAEKAAWPTPGTDAELLESGITPADILAHAQDYGRWARDNLAQLNTLLELHKD